MKPMTRWAMAAVLGLALGAAAMTAPTAMAQTGKSDAKKDQPTTAATDVKPVLIIFRNGNEVRGELISESATIVKVRVEIAGMKAETEYSKADILEIKHLPASTDPAPAKTEEKKPEAVKETRPATGSNAQAGEGPRVYVLDMRGEFGRDVSITPMQEVYEDIKVQQPDVLVMRFDHEFTHQGEDKMDIEHDQGAFDQMDTARKIADLLYQKMSTDSSIPKKPRMVSWINKAMGSAAFLPFAAKDIYFTSEGLLGGIGYADTLFAGRGDAVVREKQISLRLARAFGFAEQGGHDKKIMAAMCRADYVLSVSFKNGTPEFLDRMPESADEILLTDDGKDDRRDAIQDIIRGRGNDVLTLNAEMAFRLGLSKGTADTLDDLMDRMGLPRNYQVVKGAATEILKSWSRQVAQAEENFTRLLQQYLDVEVRQPAGYRERTEARGRRKSLLKQMKPLLARYAESINPQRIRAYPENFIQRIDLLITELDAQQQADKDRR
ncbi:MAG: hypothetical protein IT438_11870 [Phycisphaerales bacterium]|nr:hypothetical protein [Phycisphaerales bacterium]